MNNKIIYNLLFWTGTILTCFVVWNKYLLWLIIPGIVLILLSWFFTDESAERRQKKRMDKWKKKHLEKKHNEEVKDELEKLHT